MLGWLAGGALVGGLVATNPDPEAYQVYATAQVNRYLNDEVCNQIPSEVADLFQGRCAEIVEIAQPQLQTLIRDRTERLNLGILSLYQTRMGIPELGMLPQYEVKTLGIVGRFLPISAEQIPQ